MAQLVKMGIHLAQLRKVSKEKLPIKRNLKSRLAIQNFKIVLKSVFNQDLKIQTLDQSDALSFSSLFHS